MSAYEEEASIVAYNSVAFVEIRYLSIPDCPVPVSVAEKEAEADPLTYLPPPEPR
jgi:hypothetical protein